MPTKPDRAPSSCRISLSLWKFHIHAFLGLISFWPFLILMAFLGPLTSGLVFLVGGFGAPLRPLRPAFWLLLRAVRSFCSCSLCSHLYGKRRKPRGWVREGYNFKQFCLNQSYPEVLILVLLLTVLCYALQGCRCQYVMGVCGGESATGFGVGEFVLDQLMKMMTAHLVCMLHVSAHLMSFQKSREAGTTPSER